MDWCTVNPVFEDSVKQGCGQTKVKTATRREARAVQPEHQPRLFNIATELRYSKWSPFTIAKTPQHHATARYSVRFSNIHIQEDCVSLLPSSYLGSMEGFDLKLIPEFDGGSKYSVTEWLEKLELVCKLRKITDVASVILLRLTGRAFAVYLQLAESDRKSTEKVKEALLAAFAVDQYVAYEQFISRKLLSVETPDVYLAELWRLASLFSGMSDKARMCFRGWPTRGSF